MAEGTNHQVPTEGQASELEEMSPENVTQVISA